MGADGTGRKPGGRKGLGKAPGVRHQAGVSQSDPPPDPQPGPHPNLPGCPDPSSFIAGGASADVYRLGDGLVLKLFRAGAPGGMVRREFEIAGRVHAAGLPVPAAVELREEDGRMGIVYEELEGPNLLAWLKKRPHRVPWALSEMARLHVAIHRCAVPGLRTRREIIEEDIHFAPIGDRLRRAALARLEWLPDSGRLVHGDFHPANIVVTPRGLTVIDWSKAAAGEPAADLARTEMLMRFGPGPVEEGPGARVRARMLDLAAARYATVQAAIAPVATETMAAWRPLVALAWLRQRLPGRDAAFARYLDAALAAAGLPEAG